MHKETMFLIEGQQYQVVVSFELSYDDWLQIQKTRSWKKLSRALEEKQNKYNKNCHRMNGFCDC